MFTCECFSFCSFLNHITLGIERKNHFYSTQSVDEIDLIFLYLFLLKDNSFPYQIVLIATEQTLTFKCYYKED